MTVKTKYSGPIEVAGVSSEARAAGCRADVLNEAAVPENGSVCPTPQYQEAEIIILLPVNGLGCLLLPVQETA